MQPDYIVGAGVRGFPRAVSAILLRHKEAGNTMPAKPSTSGAQLGYAMQIKIDFLCPNCNLAAALVLSFYFRTPVTAAGLYPEHDIVIQ